jgi:drug/metabolite transporter (DMT)-like permease
MLLATVLLWALNLSVTRYILTHGFAPLAYAVIRYGVAAAAFVVLTLVLERTLRIGRGVAALVLAAAGTLWLNQLAFVYTLETTTASTLGLILGATPVFAALIGRAVGLERVGSRFWLAALVSFAGVALVAVGTGTDFSSDLRGSLLGVATAATWAAYSVAITPLMREHSPYRVSAVVLALTWLGLALVGGSQTLDQDLDLGWEVWVLFAFAVFGPLVVTNILWFRSLDRIGPSRATLAANLQPFVAAVLGVLLLDESLTAVQVAGGVLIALGIVLARRRPRAVSAPRPG